MFRTALTSQLKFSPRQFLPPIPGHRLKIPSASHTNCPRVSCGFDLNPGSGKLELAAALHEHEQQLLPPLRPRSVALFWDLDNKPPNDVPPYDAALRLRTLAGELGEVVDMVAYANRNAFTYIPPRVREQRQERKLLDQLEKRGLIEPANPYICYLCGRRCKTNLDRRKHFKRLHERERQHRLNYLGSLRGKRRERYLEKVATKERKYEKARGRILIPRVGYGLATELKRAGVHVRTVERKPQAADLALIRHMNWYIDSGLECLVLVSDDADFVEVLRNAREKGLVTVVVGDYCRLRREADTSLLWEDVVSGKARFSPSSLVHRLRTKEQTVTQLSHHASGDSYDDYGDEERDYSFEDEGRLFSEGEESDGDGYIGEHEEDEHYALEVRDYDH